LCDILDPAEEPLEEVTCADPLEARGISAITLVGNWLMDPDKAAAYLAEVGAV
jgi:hypothetical protein